jgi:signal transduction histidine kinase
MFGAHSDITEKMIAENELQAKINELEALYAKKDKFFSIIAHDLKSPLNSIMGFSELLMEQIKDADYEGIEKYAENNLRVKVIGIGRKTSQSYLPSKPLKKNSMFVCQNEQ